VTIAASKGPFWARRGFKYQICGSTRCWWTKAISFIGNGIAPIRHAGWSPLRVLFSGQSKRA